MRKITIILVVFSICTVSLSAFDLSGSLHVDSFAGKPMVGFSFLAEEDIIPRLAVRAQTDYLTANEYDVQILGIAKLGPVFLGGGFALEITNNLQPGAGLLLGWQMTKHFALETATILSFTPEDLGKLHDIRGKLNVFYDTENVNADFSYKIKMGIATTDFINTLAFQVEAFEQGIPVGLTVGAGSDFFIDEQGFNLTVDVLGGLNVYGGKYGTYFAAARIGIFTLRVAQPIHYEVIMGARFSL